jgi:hypothetical protein
LFFLFPDMLDRSCDDCERFQYHDTPKGMGELIMLESGKPMPRPKGCLTPCYMCPKIPKSARVKNREAAIEPTEKSLAAIQHYKRCAAVRIFPDDEIVARNAVIIGDIEQQSTVIRSTDSAALLALVLANTGKRK